MVPAQRAPNTGLLVDFRGVLSTTDSRSAISTHASTHTMNTAREREISTCEVHLNKLLLNCKNYKSWFTTLHISLQKCFQEHTFNVTFRCKTDRKWQLYCSSCENEENCSLCVIQYCLVVASCLSASHFKTDEKCSTSTNIRFFFYWSGAVGFLLFEQKSFFSDLVAPI